MTENTKIEWADHTFNPWEGCTKISPACDNCYAAERAARFNTVEWGGPRRRTSAANWKAPIKWQKDANKFAEIHGRRQRVFCASLADVFDNQVPTEWRDDLWDLIRQCPDLDWLLLTKRPQNIAKMKPDFFHEINGRIWLGTTVENQEAANRNIPHLLEHDSAVRFLSCEPLLSPIDLLRCTHRDSKTFSWLNYDPTLNALTGNYPELEYSERPHPRRIKWVIAGGESGPNARPTHPDWIRSLRDQCAETETPFFFKQWGEWLPWDQFNGAHIDDCPEQTRYPTQELNGCEYGEEDQWENVGRPTWNDDVCGADCVARVGKKAAGRLLDGVEHNGVPE